MPPPLPPADAAVGAAFPVALATPLTKGAVVGVVRGPFGPVLALRGAGLGADMVLFLAHALVVLSLFSIARF